MSKKHHRKKDRRVIRMEAPPDYSALMPETPEPAAPEELGVRAGSMSIDSVLAQLASIKDNAESFLEPDPADPEGQEIWKADIAAIEAATAILSALQDEGVADAEKVKDLIYDYNLSQKEIRELHRKFIEPAPTQVRAGQSRMEQHCPECDAQLPTSVFYKLNHCEICGKRIMRPGEISRRRNK